MRDKLWFFANYRDFGSHDDILGMFGNLNAGESEQWTYVAGSEPEGPQRGVDERSLLPVSPPR